MESGEGDVTLLRINKVLGGGVSEGTREGRGDRQREHLKTSIFGTKRKQRVKQFTCSLI